MIRLIEFPKGANKVSDRRSAGLSKIKPLFENMTMKPDVRSTEDEATNNNRVTTKKRKISSDDTAEESHHPAFPSNKRYKTTLCHTEPTSLASSHDYNTLLETFCFTLVSVRFPEEGESCDLFKFKTIWKILSCDRAGRRLMKSNSFWTYVSNLWNFKNDRIQFLFLKDLRKIISDDSADLSDKLKDNLIYNIFHVRESERIASSNFSPMKNPNVYQLMSNYHLVTNDYVPVVLYVLSFPKNSDPSPSEETHVLTETDRYGLRLADPTDNLGNVIMMLRRHYDILKPAADNLCWYNTIRNCMRRGDL